MSKLFFLILRIIIQPVSYETGSSYTDLQNQSCTTGFFLQIATSIFSQLFQKTLLILYLYHFYVHLYRSLVIFRVA